MQLMPAAGVARGIRVEGLIIFLVAWFVVSQFVLPRFGIRPG